ncbi:hypothetical protein PMAYCL1PPCAC_31992, partial [Pristionchus mayeri]
IPPPVFAPLPPAILPAPPCIPAPAFPCYYPPPVLPPPTTTFRPLRDPTVTPTEEPMTQTTPSTITSTATTTTTTTTEEPTTTEEITTTTEEPSTTTEEITTTFPLITTSLEPILVTTTRAPPITTAVLPVITSTTTRTTTVRPARDQPCIAYPLEPCFNPCTLCVGGSRCVQGICLCRPNEEAIDGECSAIPQPPMPIPPPPTVLQLQQQLCQSQSCCQPGYVFQNQQCNPPPKIRTINIMVGSQCSNAVQCDRGAYCLSGFCQCSRGYHQLNNRCISLRQLL